MARFTIYSKDGSKERYSGTPKYSGTYLNVAFVEFSNIETPLPIQWEVGDYIDYHRTGKRYRLYTIPEPKKQARPGAYGASFVYSGVKFYEATKELEIALFRDLVPEDNQIHFSTRADVSTYENVYGIASRIQECMDDLYPDRWRIEVYNTSDADLLALFNETKEYSVSNGSCLDALSQIYETWKNVGWVHTYDSVNDKDVITIGKTSIRTEDNTTDAFVYGINNGLTSIKKAALNEGEFATRLYVYGSDRNIQTRHYNSKNILDAESVNIVNLMIPVSKWGKTDGLPDARKAYIQADDAVIAKYGLIPRIVYFNGSENEEIYPSIKGLTMAEVRKAMIDAGQSSSPFLPVDRDLRIDVVGSVNFGQYDNGTKEEYEANPTFDIGLRNVGFDIAEQGKLTDEGYATISMKSGMCAGRDFKIKKIGGAIYGDPSYGNYTYYLEKVWDDSLGMAFPNKIYHINAGDEFVLLDIPMPEYYITLAEERLYKAGANLLADYSKVSAFYEPSINPIKIKEGGKPLRQGMYMKVYDEDVIDTKDNTDYVLIDTLTIDETTAIPTYKVTLREQKRAARTFGALEEMIEDAKHTAREEISRQRNYTERRFRSAQETITLLKGALDHYSEGINPITVETMSLLLGDKNLQYRFTSSKNSLESISCPVSYDAGTKQMVWSSSVLVHLTLGIDAVTTSSARKASDFKSWSIPASASSEIADADARYIYAKVPQNGGNGAFVVSKTSISLESVSGYYHFLVGILNSEYEGTRDFVPLYGFTEILPGQISTDVIRSADGRTYFDLEKGKIAGEIEFIAGSSGLENLAEWSQKQSQIDKAIADAKSAKDTADTANAASLVLQEQIVEVETGLNQSIAEINQKLDGVVESFFDKYTPSRSNEPARTWIAEGSEADHIGDTFTNTETSGEDAGKSWRWLKQENGTYDWQLIADSDATKALALAGEAQTTADGKSKTFLVKPSGYSKGDIWIVGADYVPYAYKQGDLLSAQYSSNGYVESHWSKVVRYAGSEELSAVEQSLNKAIDDAESASKKYTDEGKKALQNAIDALEEAKADITDVYTKAEADGLIDKAEADAIKKAQELATAAQNAAIVTAKAYADGEIDEAEKRAIEEAEKKVKQAKDALDKALLDLDTKLSAEVQSAIDSANTAIENAEDAEELANAAKALAETAQNNASKAVSDAGDAKQVANDAQALADAASKLADTAKGIADSAKSSAEKAQEDAEKANDTLVEWASDGVVSPMEKQKYAEELTTASSDWSAVNQEAVLYGFKVGDVEYDNFVYTFGVYAGDLRAIVNSADESVAVPEGFSNHISAYYSAKSALLIAISNKAKAVSDDASSAAADAKAFAEQAKEIAESALDAADDAISLLSAVDADCQLTGIEKQSLRESMGRITSITDPDSLLADLPAPTGTYEVTNPHGYGNGANVVKAGDSNNGYSQSAFVGWNALKGNGANNINTARILFHLDFATDVTIEYQSNAESLYDYLVVGALDADLNFSSVRNGSYKEVNDDPSKPTSTCGKQDTILAKTFPMSAGDHYIDVCYKKDSGIDTATDCGYFRVVSEGYGIVTGKELKADGTGSFPAYYNKLRDGGFYDESDALHDNLYELLSFLKENSVWIDGTSEVGADFRSTLQGLIAVYCGFEADGVKALASDWEYLKGAFAKGTTNVSGGVVMTNMVAVKDAEESDVEAFLNGSGFASDDEHRKLILAAGIPSQDEQSGSLEERSRSASTRIYEDGTIDTTRLIAREGVISEFEISGDWIKADKENYETLISPARISTSASAVEREGAKFTTLVNMQAYPGAGRDAVLTAEVSASDVTIQDTKAVALNVSARGAEPAKYDFYGSADYTSGGNFAVYCRNGLYAGLRPKCMVMSSTTSKTFRCSALDHTVISDWTSGSSVVYLPEAPQDGQEIRVWKSGAHQLTISTSDGKEIHRVGVLRASQHSFDANYNGYIDLVYHSTLGRWLMCVVYSE